MAIQIGHATHATAPDSGNGKISTDAWNESHSISGDPNTYFGFDANGLPSSRAIPVPTVKDFGAPGTGSSDDTAGIQAALSASAGNIIVPPGTYNVTSPLNYAFPGQRLIGGGASSTQIIFHTGTSSGLVCNGLNTCGFSGIKFKGSGNTGGELILIENCSAFIGKDFRVETGYRGITVLSTNNVTLENFVFADHTGDYALRFAGSSTTRADVLKLHGGEFSHFSNSAITSILWESYAHSTTLQDVRVIRGGQGLKIWDSSGAGTDLSIPSFLEAAVLEFDFTNGEAIRADDLHDAWITNLYSNAATGTNGVHFGANSWSIRANNMRVASASNHGIYVGGRFILLSNSRAYANGQAASNTYDGIFVDSTAADVTVTGCASGYDNSFGTQQRYGINIDPAAIRVAYFGNDLNGNLSGPANGGTDQQYRVGSSNRHSLYNSNGLHLSVGGSTAGVVNNLRIAGGAAGGAPQILAEGSDTDISAQVTPKGAGILNVASGGYGYAGTKVVGARDTGWTAMTGTSDKASAFATGSVTLAQLAGRVMAMQAALATHGLIGS